MIRIRIRILISSLLLYLVLIVTMENVHAYEGGLTHGKPWKSGLGNNVNSVTDGNVNTSFTLRTTDGPMSYTFDDVHYIEGFRINFYNSHVARIRLYNPNNELIHTFDITSASLSDQYVELKQDNVKRITVENNRGGFHFVIREMDFFGAMQAESISGFMAESDVRRVNLSWAKIDSVDLVGYNVYRNDELLNTIPIAQNHYTVFEPVIDVPNVYYITAVYRNGYETEPSLKLTRISYDSLLIPPEIRATIFPNRLQLTWTQYPNVRYTLYQLVNDTEYELLRDSTATAYTHSNLTTDQSYTYKLVTTDKYNRLYTSTATFVTAEPPEPQKLTLRIVRSTYNSLEIGWNAILSPYTIYVNGEQIANDVLGTTYTLTNLDPKTTYDLQVGYIDQYERYVKSDVLKATTNDLPAPVAPNLRIVATTENSIRLTWTSTGRTYKLLQDGQEILTTNALMYTVTGLNPSTSYSFRLIAVDQFDREIESNIVTATTKEPPPPPTPRPQPTKPPAVSDSGNKDLDEANDHLYAGAEDTKKSFLSLIWIIIAILIMIVGTLFLIRVFKKKMAKSAVRNSKAAVTSTSTAPMINKASTSNYRAYRSTRSRQQNYNRKRGNYYGKKRNFKR